MTTSEAIFQVVTDLRHLANSLELLVEAPNAEYIPTDDEPKTPIKETVPVKVEHCITFNEIRAVLQQKSRSGYREEVNNLILSYGVNQLSEIPEDKYPDLLKAAEEMKS